MWIYVIGDILMASVRTCGIVEQDFVINGKRFHFLDLGGQRHERLKWGHCFKQVAGVIFVAALSGYDQTLVEDAKVNRLDEAVALFQEVVNTPELANTNMVVFLNKLDLFEARLKQKPIKQVIPDYHGEGQDVEGVVAWVRHRFNQVKPGIKIHTISAVENEIEKLEHVFIDVAEVLLQQANTLQ